MKSEGVIFNESEGNVNRENEMFSGHSNIPAAITDTGCERSLNEDRYAAIESPSGVAWIVCDGMGGATGGELAAQLVIDAIKRDLENYSDRSSEAALKGAILEANRIIVLRRQNQAFAQMGTTITSVLFNGPEVVLANVGDSRAYLIRDNAIQGLTTDHTFVQELVDKGQISADEALSHPQAHILTRCIGAEPGLDIDLFKYWIWDNDESEQQDLMLLCTDGLYSLISEGELANIVSQNTPQKACVELVELAKSRGGYDNITLAIIPLGGQLRQERPVGYEGHRRVASRKKQAETNEARMNPFRLMLIVTTLSILAMLVTIIGVVISIGR
jgi:serine/threonine protein phosphatase PrpC